MTSPVQVIYIPRLFGLVHLKIVTSPPLRIWMLQNQAAWFLIGREETGKEFEIYSAGQPLHWHEIPNLCNQDYFLKQWIFKLKNLIFKYKCTTIWLAEVSYTSVSKWRVSNVQPMNVNRGLIRLKFTHHWSVEIRWNVFDEFPTIEIPHLYAAVFSPRPRHYILGGWLNVQCFTTEMRSHDFTNIVLCILTHIPPLKVDKYSKCFEKVVESITCYIKSTAVPSGDFKFFFTCGRKRGLHIPIIFLSERFMN